MYLPYARTGLWPSSGQNRRLATIPIRSFSFSSFLSSPFFILSQSCIPYYFSQSCITHYVIQKRSLQLLYPTTSVTALLHPALFTNHYFALQSVSALFVLQCSSSLFRHITFILAIWSFNAYPRYSPFNLHHSLPSIFITLYLVLQYSPSALLLFLPPSPSTLTPPSAFYLPDVTTSNPACPHKPEQTLPVTRQSPNDYTQKDLVMITSRMNSTRIAPVEVQPPYP
jgi:hypothetical protein